MRERRRYLRNVFFLWWWSCLSISLTHGDKEGSENEHPRHDVASQCTALVLTAGGMVVNNILSEKFSSGSGLKPALIVLTAAGEVVHNHVDGAGAEQNGLGLVVEGGRLSFRGCFFDTIAGSVVVRGGEAMFTGCVFEGSVRVRGGISTFVRCLFTGNVISNGIRSAILGVGAVDVDACWAKARFYKCVFDSNAAIGCGGALYVHQRCGKKVDIHIEEPAWNESNAAHVAVIVDYCVFRNNSALKGGAVCVADGAAVVIMNSKIVGNTANEEGGGVFLSTHTAGNKLGAVVENCSILHNCALTGGGVWINGSGLIKGCHLQGNLALSGGGGLSAAGAFRIQKCLIEENQAEEGGDNVRFAGAGGGGTMDDHTAIIKSRCTVQDHTHSSEHGECHNSGDSGTSIPSHTRPPLQEDRFKISNHVGHKDPPAPLNPEQLYVSSAYITREDSACDHQRIFVSIASYRDDECAQTVLIAFSAATIPCRIFVGVVEQHDELWDGRCISLVSKVFPSLQNHVRVDAVPHHLARGPVWARARVARLYADEDFVLQIDSHTRFACGWDTSLITMHNSTGDAKAILTAYPPAFFPGMSLPHHVDPSRLCADRFDDSDGMLRLKGVEIPREACMENVTVASLFWAAGFSFSSGSVVSTVPYDGALSGLFFGEEAVMAARLWTHGYNFYAPCQNVVFHLWERAYRKTFWDLQPNSQVPVETTRR